MGKQDKTNCMRVLESKKIPYTPHLYEADPTLSGEDIARILQEAPDQVFKTLVTDERTAALMYEQLRSEMMS